MALPDPGATSENVAVSNVCVLGATGLLGRALCRSLRGDGIAVVPFSRRAGPDNGEAAHWDPASGVIERDRLRGADAVVNLAGESLDEGRWTRARKQQFRQSRVGATELIARTLAEMSPRPNVLINASAIGFYGDRGDEAVSEESPAGSGYLAELVQAWEAATAPAREAGVRVVCVRMGVVLTPQGGALAKLLPLFRLGMGGRLGRGNQRMPWIALDDAVGVIRFAMTHTELEGPVNAVAPESVSNAQFTEALAGALHRPHLMPVPAFALKAAVGGEMAREMLLGGANVRPRKLEIAGYRFEYPRLEDALEMLLPKSGRSSTA